MEKLIFELTCRVLQKSPSLLCLAISRRAKFEGWLKFELADELRRHFSDTIVEHYVNPHLIDIYSNQSLIELKTPNTSYVVNGVVKKGRPISSNVGGVITDISKLRSHRIGFNGGYIVFVMFPIKYPDFKTHIQKIENELGYQPLFQGLVVIGGFSTYVFVAKVF